MPDGLTPGQRRVQALAFLIGEWETTQTNGQVMRETYEWINNRSFIQYRNGEYREIIGWDLENKQLVSWCFGAAGGHARVVWTIDGDTIKTKAVPHYLVASGAPVQSEATITRVDADTLTITGTFGDSTLDGTSRRVTDSGK